MPGSDNGKVALDRRNFGASVLAAGTMALCATQAKAQADSRAGPINAADHGAHPGADGEENRFALQSALDAAHNGSMPARSVYVPPGRYEVNGPLDMRTSTVMRGEGAGATELHFFGQHGIRFHFSSSTGRQFGVTGLKLTRANGTGEVAIATPRDPRVREKSQVAVFEDLHVRGNWRTTLMIGDVHAAVVRDVVVQAPLDEAKTDSATSMYGTQCAVRLDPFESSARTVISNLQTNGCLVGLDVGSRAEGFVLADSEIVGSWIGVRVGGPDPAITRPGGFIRDVHVNALHYGVHLRNRRDVSVTGVLLYRGSELHGLDLASSWEGVLVQNCETAVVTQVNCRFLGPMPAAGAVGVKIIDSEFVIASGLVFHADVTARDAPTPEEIIGFDVGGGEEIQLSEPVMRLRLRPGGHKFTGIPIRPRASSRGVSVVVTEQRT